MFLMFEPVRGLVKYKQMIQYIGKKYILSLIIFQGLTEK